VGGVLVMLDRIAIASALREIGALLTVQGGARFRARAYATAARALESWNAKPEALSDPTALMALPGIGRALAQVIVRLRRTGRNSLLERLRQELPKGVLQLRQVPHMTLRRIRILQEALGIATVAELKTACADGRVRAVKGFGEKLVQNIRDGLAKWETEGGLLLLPHAEREGHGLLAFVRNLPGVRDAALAGEIRRRAETTKVVAMAVAAVDPERVVDDIVHYPPVVAVIEHRADGCILRLADGAMVRVDVGPVQTFAGLLLWATGAAVHGDRLVEIARHRGMELDRRGLTRHASGRTVVAEDEAALYRQLGLPFIPPEMREGAGEVEAALAGTLPTDLIGEDDIQGLVHCHTDYSDGMHSIEQMARAADDLGMKYLTITDHSPTAHYANGVAPDRLQKQWDEIARVQELVQVTLLRGTECDILADGSLDYDDDILARLDVIIASIHNRYKMDAEQMTRRLVTAMRHPFFKIWGHALGRFVARRPPIECRVEEVLDAAAESRVAIELNGDPHRLDMEPHWQRQARARGIPFVVSTDAHSIGQFANLGYGVSLARRGWVTRGETLNALGTAAFRAAVRPV